MTNNDRIVAGLKWLEERNDSTDIVGLSQGLNRLAILTVRLGEEVTEAYALQSDLEDQYDTKFAKRFSELTASGTSAAAAKVIVEAELALDKGAWTQGKILYKRLNSFLERTDRVLDTFRQYISCQKQADMKNI